MERLSQEARLDPAIAVARLLTRLGLFLLVVIAPIVAMFSRRGVVVLIPIATALLIIAAALEGRLAAALRRFVRLLMAPHALGFIVLLAYAGLSLAWTPVPGLAGTRLLNIALTFLLFVAATACVREQVRLSDVNLIPVGVALAAVALALEYLPGSPLAGLIDPDGDIMGNHRAAMLLALLVWPAIGSLFWRDRRWQAIAIGLITVLALWLVRNLVIVTAFLAGTAAYVLAVRQPRLAPLVVGSASLVLLALAPLAGWLMARYGGFLLPREGDELVGIWRDVTYALPSHLFTGFGFDASAVLARGVDGDILASPRNTALQIWLELGLVGVLLAAGTITLSYFASTMAVERHRPAVLAVLSSATIMMYSGLAAWQIWWLTMLGLTSLSLSFVSRLSAR